MASKENQYKQQLIDLGVYDPAFEPEIHQLCILERELSRSMKAWKDTAPKGQAPLATDPMYTVISKQRRDILAHRNALGLTPTALKRIRARQTQRTEETSTAGTGNAAFGRVLDRLKEVSHGSGT